MRDGERVVKWLTFQEVDRPPYYDFMLAWPSALQRWRRETGFRKLDIETYFNLDKGFVDVPVPLGMFPTFEQKLIEEDSEGYVIRDERGIVMRQRHDLGSLPGFIEHPVKGWDDWLKIKSERLDPDHPGRYQIDWGAFNGYLKATSGVARVGYFPYGVFGTARDLMGAEELLIAFIAQPDLVHDIMDYLTGMWIRIYERIANNVEIACIHLWEDMSGKQGSLISPQMVNDFMMPNYRRVKEFAESKNIPLVSVDSDGDVSELVPIMMENGINFYWPFEVQAGCDVAEYRQSYPALSIYGGVDKRALAKGRKEIDREIERVEPVLKLGGYIPAPDHLVPPDVPWDNFNYYMQKLKTLVGKK